MKKLLLVSIVLILALRMPAQCMSGLYTIGGASPNYPTFTAAVAALTANGVCGPVSFRVRDGVYTEQFSIPPIVGTSAVNYIHFSPDIINSPNVIVQYASSTTAPNNYVTQLNGCNNVTFLGIRFNRTGTNAYCRVLSLINNAAYNHVLYCPLTTQVGLVTGDNYAAAWADTSNVHHNEFEGNIITGGSYGIYLVGPTLAHAQENIIELNNFVDQSANHIYTSKQYGIKIIGNTNAQSLVSSNLIGVALYNCTGDILIDRNRIFLTTGALSLAYCTHTALTPIQVSNNFLKSNTGIALALFACQYVNVYNNSISMQSSTAGAGLQLDLGNNIRIINNCIQSGQRTLNILLGSAVTACDYNNLYPQNSTALGWNMVYYANLNAWRTATGLDMNSVSVLPGYISPLSNLHVTANIDLESGGTFLPTVTTDVDNTSRNNPPDIGADEFTSPADDVRMIGTTLMYPICPGTNAITARFRNTGTSPLISVMIGWKINNTVQTPFLWTGNLASGDTSAFITISSYTFLNANYSVKIWCYLPNSVVDPTPQTDSIIYASTLPRMSGVYTIGGVSPNYATFTAAVAALNTRGVCGPVTFNVRDGVYNEKIVLQDVTGASPVNRITFQGESLDSSVATLQFAASTSSSNNYVVQFNGGDYFTFRHLTIRRNNLTGGFNAIVIHFINDANDNRFENCRLWGTSNVNSSFPTGGQTIVYSSNITTLTNDSMTFVNSRFIDGTTGLNASRPTSPSLLPEKAWTIHHNVFTGQSELGITLSNKITTTVTDNVITTTRDTLTGANFYGILLVKCYDGALVSHNEVTHLSGYGIYISACPATAISPGLVINNMVSNKEFGLVVAATTNYNFYHNSINNWGPPAGTYVYAQLTSSGIKLFNNILCHSNGGKIFTTTPATSLQSDYNDYFTSGAFSNSYPLFSMWQATGHDTESVFIQPPFISNTNLHIAQSDTLNNRGDSLGIALDHDYYNRSLSAPDIGADEFDSAAHCDIGVRLFVNPDGTTCHGLPRVAVNVKNYENTLTGDTVQSFLVFLRINSTMVDSVLWTGTLLPGDSVDVTVTYQYTFLYAQTYTLEAWTRYPNNITDTVTQNDTIELITSNISMGGVYTIGGYHPDFYSFNQAKTALVNMGVCDSVIFDVRPAIYSEQLQIPAIQGAGPFTSITFRGENGDSINSVLNWVNTFNIFDWVVYLNGADYIRFEHLSIGYYANPNTYYAPIVILRNGATNNRFSNNVMYGRYSNLNSTQFTTFQIRGDGNHNTVIENNRFVNGIYLIVTDSITPGNYIRNLTIRNNTAYNFDYNMFSLTQIDTLIVDHNKQMTLCGQGVTMIGISNCTGNIEITNNQLYYHFSGIGMSYCNGTPADPILIADNMYSSDNYGGNNLSAINIDTCTYVDIIHNSIAMEPPSSFVSNNLYAGITLRRGANIRVLNNNIANYGWRCAIFFARANIVTACDYNNYYSPRGTIANVPNGNTFTTAADTLHLNQWQALTGWDLNSTSVNPYFRYRNSNYVGSLPDVHLDPYNIQPLVSNVVWPGLSDDIDGDLRNPQPTLGADEYYPISVDATVSTLDPDVNICVGVDTVRTTFRNIGTTTLTSLTLAWSVNGVPQTPYNWTGSLAFGDSTSVTLGAANFVLGTNTVQIISQLPNNTADLHPQGDTLRIIINATAIPQPNLGPDLQLCSSYLVDLNAGVFANWLWSTGSQTYNEWLGPGTHWIRVSNNPGCYAYDTIVITVVPAVTPTFTGSTTICNGSSTSITANGSSTYVWNPGNLSGSTVVLSPTTTTTYTVTGTSVNNCTATGTFTITVNPIPNVTVGGGTGICPGNTATLIASGAATYNWMPGNLSGTPVTVSPAATTTYTVTGTAGNGCTTSRTVTVTVNPVPNVIASGPSQICLGSSASLGATGATTYNWMPGNINGSSITVSPTANTNYIVTGTDANGCTATDSVYIIVNALPTAAAGSDAITCPSVPVTLNGSGGISCAWTPTVSLTSPSSYTTNAAPVATTSYVQTVTDANGCQDTDTVQVIVYPVAPLSACCNQFICPGDTIQLTAIPFYSNLIWSPSIGLTPDTGTTVSAFPAVSTTYSVSAIDVNGCTVIDSVTIGVHPAVTVPTISQNGADLISSEAFGNQWYLNGNIIAGAINQIYTPTQNGLYTVVYTDANGCTTTSAVYNFTSVGIGGNGPNASNCTYNSQSDVITITFLPAGPHAITVFDARGRVVATTQVQSHGGPVLIPADLTSGVYLVQVLGVSVDEEWKIGVVE